MGPREHFLVGFLFRGPTSTLGPTLTSEAISPVYAFVKDTFNRPRHRTSESIKRVKGIVKANDNHASIGAIGKTCHV